MSVVKSSLSEADLKLVGEALQGALVDLVDLSLVAKQVHWNVVGPRFRSVHLQLDEVVATARQHSDTVAERASAIGVTPDGRAATWPRQSAIGAVPDGWIKDTDAVRRWWTPWARSSAGCGSGSRRPTSRTRSPRTS